MTRAEATVRTRLEEMPSSHDPEDEKEERLDQDHRANVAAETEWKPGKQFYLTFSPLVALALIVSIDGTIVSVALPVRDELLII